MIPFIMLTPQEMIVEVAKAARAKRLSLNMSQKHLSETSGVSFGVIKKFELTGRISFESLVKIALTLDSFGEFQHLFKAKELHNISSLDELLADKKRKRGRK